MPWAEITQGPGQAATGMRRAGVVQIPTCQVWARAYAPTTVDKGFQRIPHETRRFSCEPPREPGLSFLAADDRAAELGRGLLFPGSLLRFHRSCPGRHHAPFQLWPDGPAHCGPG